MSSQSLTRPIATRQTGMMLAEGAAAAPQEEVRQYITFTVGQEEYGVSILAVREIRGWTQENRLPNLPAHVRGVINLRGTIIPILDLRARFGGSVTEATKSHVVIVVQVGDMPRGLLVDAISDILTIARNQVKAMPAMDTGSEAATDYLIGLFTVEQRMVTLVDVNRLFHSDRLELALGEGALAAS